MLEIIVGNHQFQPFFGNQRAEIWSTRVKRKKKFVSSHNMIKFCKSNGIWVKTPTRHCLVPGEVWWADGPASGQADGRTEGHGVKSVFSCVSYALAAYCGCFYIISFKINVIYESCESLWQSDNGGFTKQWYPQMNATEDIWLQVNITWAISDPFYYFDKNG